MALIVETGGQEEEISFQKFIFSLSLDISFSPRARETISPKLKCLIFFFLSFISFPSFFYFSPHCLRVRFVWTRLGQLNGSTDIKLNLLFDI